MDRWASGYESKWLKKAVILNLNSCTDANIWGIDRATERCVNCSLCAGIWETVCTISSQEMASTDRGWLTRALHNKHQQQQKLFPLPYEREKRLGCIPCSSFFLFCLLAVQRWISLCNLFKLNCSPLCHAKTRNVSSSLCFCIEPKIWVVRCAL